MGFRRFMLVAASTALAVTVAACGSSSSGNSTTSTSASTPAATSSSVASSSAATSTAAPYASTSSAAGNGGAKTGLAKLDDLCSQASTAISQVTAPTFPPSQVTKATLPVVAAYVQNVTTIAETEERMLRAAVAQQPNAHLVAAIQALSTAIGQEEQALAAAKTGDAAGFKTAYTAYLAAASMFETKAKAAGLQSC